jgi:biotin operon repressor
VLASASRQSDAEVAKKLGISVGTVQWWQHRFTNEGLEAVHPAKKGYRIKYTAEVTASILQLVQTPLPNGRLWTLDALAQATGGSRAALSRILHANGFATLLQGRARQYTRQAVEHIIERLRGPKPEDAEQWTAASLARVTGANTTTTALIMAAYETGLRDRDGASRQAGSG